MFYIRKGRVVPPGGGNGRGLLRQKIGGRMSLLRQIQDGAAGDSVSLASLLRKIKLLAARLGVKEMGEWAERELSGYDSTDGLPPYRGPFEAVVLGHGADMVREYHDFSIPSIAFEEKYRESSLFKLYFLNGVAELESLAEAKETARAPWNADIVATLHVFAQKGIVQLNPNIHWFEIWKSIPYPTTVGVLDAIRTRILDFSLLLAEEEPLAEREQRLADSGRVSNVFLNTIYATSANIAQGNRDVTQTQELPAPFDTDSLMDYLRGLGLDDETLNDLQEALDEDAEEEEEDGESDEPKRPGRRALAWLNNVMATATTKVGTPVATTLITQALLHYFRF